MKNKNRSNGMDFSISRADHSQKLRPFKLDEDLVGVIPTAYIDTPSGHTDGKTLKKNLLKRNVL